MAEEQAQPKWSPARAPRERIEVGNLVVRRYEVGDAEALTESITESIEHLRPWMAWIEHEPVGIEQRRELISVWSQQWDGRQNFTMGIFEEDLNIGGTGFHLRSGPGVLEIGYWVRASRAGEGIVPRVVGALAAEAFTHDDIDSVEIRHDAGNHASRRVAEKSGFTFVDQQDVVPTAPAETGVHLRWVMMRER